MRPSTCEPKSCRASAAKLTLIRLNCLRMERSSMCRKAKDGKRRAFWSGQVNNENKVMGAVNIAALAQVKLFAGLAAEDLVALAANLQRRRYGKGQFIFQQGDPGLCLYLVESGKVKIASFSSEGKGLVLNLFGPGDFFGELALLDGEPRSADAVAQEPCQLLLLQRDDFMHFLEARPHVAIKLLATVSRRLRHTTQQAEDIIFFDLPARLARVLLELAEV